MILRFRKADNHTPAQTCAAYQQTHLVIHAKAWSVTFKRIFIILRMLNYLYLYLIVIAPLQFGLWHFCGEGESPSRFGLNEKGRVMGAVTSISAARRQRPVSLESGIEKLLSEVRIKLIETGTRNRLIHTPRGARRTRCLPIVGARPDAVFVNLVARKEAASLPRRQRPRRCFAGGGRREDRAPRQAAGSIRPADAMRAAAPCRRRSRPDLLQKRLHAIYRDAKTAEEERGVNILFLALGFLRWYEDERSDALREAPLILLPVILVRDGKRSTFDLGFRDDDIASNQALQERLRGDFGIALPDVPETDNWLPSAYFNAVAASIASKRRWTIDTEGVELGFYSSSKFLIMRDLEPANWPGNALVEHPLVRGLLLAGRRQRSRRSCPRTPSSTHILQPADLDPGRRRRIHRKRASSKAYAPAAISLCTGRRGPANRKPSRI